MALLSRVASGVVTLDADFDEGSLESWGVSGSTISLVGRDSYAFNNHQLGSGDWRWLYFKASGVLGQNLTFSISGEFAGDSTDYPPTPNDHELKDHEMVYSYDNVNWNFFPHANNQLLNIGNPNTNGANDIFRFGLGQAFNQDTVYVAYALPYQYARSVSHTQGVLSSPWAAPTVSGNANGVIGQSAGGVVDDIGRNTPPLDIFAYRITNPATDLDLPKRRAVLATGQHAGETLGIYTYEGLINWLISDDSRAAALRDKAEFFCYPTLNASGRYAGLSRAMIDAQNSDSNGFWYPNDVAGNDYVSPLRKEQKINGDAMIADLQSTPGNVTDLFIDFHSSVPDYNIDGPNGQGSPGFTSGEFRDDWGYIRTSVGDQNNPWWIALRQLQTNLLQETSGGGPSSKTSVGFALSFLGADMAVTLENQFAISRPISFYEDYGKNVGLAMYEAWVQVADPALGDFDEDGEVDEGDLAAWKLGLGMTGGAQHWQGDANGDGAVDGMDFLAWQRDFTGATSLLSQPTVPEPAARLLFITATSYFVARTRRRTRNAGDVS